MPSVPAPWDGAVVRMGVAGLEECQNDSRKEMLSTGLTQNWLL